MPVRTPPPAPRIAAAAGAALLALGVGCGGGAAEDPLLAAGRSAYLNQCTVCHNQDPTRDGAVGPAVAGASLALLEARILRAEYPPGYTPKRPTRAMAAMPHLAEDIPALAAYLGSITPTE